MDATIPNEQTVEDAPPKKKLHPGAKKNLIIVSIIGGVAVLLTIGFVFMGSSGTEQAQSTLKGGRGTEQNRDVTDSRYTAMREEQQAAAFEQAETSGSSFLGSSPEPTVNEGFSPDDLNITDKTNPALANTKVKPSTRAGGAQYANTGGPSGGARIDQFTAERIEKRAASVARQMETIFEQQIPVDHVTVDYRVQEPEQTAQAGSQFNQPGFDRAPVAAPVQPDASKPPGYDQQLYKSAMATLDKPVQADRDTLVIATVRSGPYEGARIQGIAKRDLDQFRVEFTSMTFGGQVYQVRASGLDQMTLSTLVEGDYDGNVLARYVAPFLFSTAGAIAEARGQQDQSIIVGGQGQIVQNQPKPTDSEAIARGISEGIRTAGRVFAENVKPATVSAPTNSALAIIWLN